MQKRGKVKNKKPTQADINEYILLQDSPIYFIQVMWKLSPQPIKPEFQGLITLLITQGKLNEITADYFQPKTREECLKEKLFSWQQWLILLAIEQAIQGKATNRISVRSGHGIGKSTTLSWILLWYLYCHYLAQINCTAPTGDQMYDVLWKEVSIWLELMPRQARVKFEWQANYVRIVEHPEAWFARARTARKESPEALAGMHGENIMVLVDEACFDDKTEVLTNDGFKFFKNLTDDDKVLSMDLKTEEAVFDKPIKKMEYDGEREMYFVKKRGCDFAVTANHKMVYSNRKISSNRLKEIKEFSKSGNVFFPRKVNFLGQNQEEFISISEYKTERKKHETLKFKMTDWVEFVAWYLSEGCIIYHDRGKTVNITQSKNYNPEKFERIEKLLKRMGLKYNIYSDLQIQISYQQIVTELQKYGKGFKNKFIPDYVKKSKYADLFLDVFCLGDGYNRKNRRIFYSSSKKMIDDLQEMLFLSGSAGTISIRAMEDKKWYRDHYIQTKETAYVLCERMPTKIKYSKSGLEIKNYKGKVYCVTTKYGNIFTRRNGRCMWSGNSGVPDQIFNTMEGSMTDNKPMIIMISNPTRLIGYFYDSQKGQDAKNWQKFSFSCIDSPFIDNLYVDRIIAKNGKDSDEYRIRVLGEFPREDAVDEQGYVPLLSKDDIKQVPIVDNNDFVGQVRMGIDIAGEGTDKTVWVARDAFKAKVVLEEAISNPKKIALRTLGLCELYKIAAEDIYIDMFGIGADTVKELYFSGFYGQSVQVGDKPDDDEDQERFLNKRACFYFRLRKWIKSGGELERHKAWEEELTSVRYRRSSGHQKIQIMPKKESRSKGYHSPDHVDGLMLTFTDSREDYGKVETVTPGMVQQQHETMIYSSQATGRHDAI